jgi:hypothetical protein
VYGETAYAEIPYGAFGEEAAAPETGELILTPRASIAEREIEPGQTKRTRAPLPPFEGRFVPGHRGVGPDIQIEDGSARRSVVPGIVFDGNVIKRNRISRPEIYTEPGFARHIEPPVSPPDPFIIIKPRKSVPIPPIDPGTTSRHLPPHPEKVLTIQLSRRTRIDEDEAWGARVRRTRIAPILYPDIRLVPSRKSEAAEETHLFQGRDARRPYIIFFGLPPEDIVRMLPRRVVFAHEVEEEQHGYERFRPQPPSGEGPARSPCPEPPSWFGVEDNLPLATEAEAEAPAWSEAEDSLPPMMDECR